ncbi:hypothetical protein [Sandarakinorhabdus limnophila]|uniref:hypothetical protein n=1 Tax=Sandarakinorhabdus limnophila TaxID=210512 RepID=UPI0012EBDBD3|nr:hypothetical protein [Sandarakinorhabdus limnophila]
MATAEVFRGILIIGVLVQLAASWHGGRRRWACTCCCGAGIWSADRYYLPRGRRNGKTAPDRLGRTRAVTLAALAADGSAAPIDATPLMAGQVDAGPPRQIVEPAEQVALLPAVNLAGPAALVAALATSAVARGRGRILLIVPAAAFHALPYAHLCRCKAGLARFVDALLLRLRP